MIDLTIIIVSYNARADLEGCLASIHAAPPVASHEVIVVDNASTDGSQDVVARWPGIRLIRAPTNVGFAAANNLGFRAARGTHVLLLNSDTVVLPGAIDRLLAVLEAHPHAAVAGPRLVDGQGRAELSFGRMIGPISELRQQRVMRALARGDAAVAARVDALTRQEHSPDWVSGACLLVRRADAEAVGLLDERFFMYTEDVDFCAAIRARGRGVLFVPSVEVVHLRGRSVAAAPAATRAAYRRSHLAFYRKHHPLIAPLVRVYHAWQERREREAPPRPA